MPQKARYVAAQVRRASDAFVLSILVGTGQNLHGAGSDKIGFLTNRRRLDTLKP